MVRKSNLEDIDQVADIYERVIAREAIQPMTGWRTGVYPSYDTALAAHRDGELFVLEAEGAVVASAILNQKQVDIYADCAWEYDAQDDEVLVIHTLAVDPEKSGRGYATQFLSFYENLALESGCRALRLDTNEINSAARTLYGKAGYREAGIFPCEFQGLAGVRLVCLEKALS